ncbi:MAG: hypothetical protein JJU02_12615 [Cryomorphaceae bacterium]|nr:hypothetical protein [Cryomorphaceae bacterium]
MISKLRNIVNRNCISRDENTTTLKYWSEVVFANCVFALVPLSLLAIIPAVIICLKKESYMILWFDLFCFTMLIIVAYFPGMTVRIRKIMLMSLLFLAAFVLLLELGSFGPGLVYLLSATIFILLLFPGKKTIIPFVLTLLFCVGYGFLIHINFANISVDPNINVLEWIAISSNVLFISAILTLMIPFFLSKLESTLEEKVLLLESVRKKNLELNKSIEEVKTKNAELEQFAFIASHDLQEPLRMIASFMALLKKKYENKLDDKAHQYINFATGGAKRMKQIIQDLLLYSGAGKNPEPMEEVDLNEILLDYQLLRNKLISERSAEINVERLPIVHVQKTPIVQTVHSLLDNAINYTKDNFPPEISIFAEEIEDFWKICIRDNGIGIDPLFFEKIFVIFQRLHNRGDYEGTGIGLAVAKKHVELWGGEIWLESELEKGSTFYFTLPKNVS